MIKGVSRQVIVVHSPDPKLFEQAIFILNDHADVTDEMLLQEAQKIIRSPKSGKKRRFYLYGAVWACGGALITGIAWLLTSLF